MKNSEVKARIDAHKAERSSIESAWMEVDKYVMPFRGKFRQATTRENENNWKERDQYDSTAPDSAQGLAASLHGSLTSMVTRWFELRFSVKKFNDVTEAKQWLEDVADLIFETLQGTNFNLEASEGYLDLVGYGNAAVMEEIDGDYTNYKGISFKALPLRECYFDQDVNGNVLNFFRVVEWTPLQMVEKFGHDAVPERVREAVLVPEASIVKENVYFAIYKRKLGPDQVEIDTMKPASPGSRPYGYKYVIEKGLETLGSEGGYYEMPVYIPRWRKSAGSKWGYSPAMVGMGDILTINQHKQLVLTAGEKVVDPPSMVNQKGVIGDVDLRPGGQTVVKSDGAIKPYESGAKFDVSQIIQADLQNAIRRVFFADQLELKESPAMTATEVSVRYELMQRLLGPTLGRLQHDFLRPLIERTYMILARANKLPAMPDTLRQAGAIKIEYIGPLSRSQKMDEMSAVQRWIGMIMTVSQVRPDVLDVVDWDKVGKESAELAGVPSRFMATEAKIKKVRDARQKEREQMKEVEIAKAKAEILRNAGSGIADMSKMNQEQQEAA